MNWYRKSQLAQKRHYTRILTKNEYPWKDVLSELLEGAVERVDSRLHELGVLKSNEMVNSIFYDTKEEAIHRTDSDPQNFVRIPDLQILVSS